jgi:23S rRNA pseudouridine2457 synthase
MPIYLKFYKPFQVLSQFTDSVERETLKNYIPVPGVYSAGRLDYRSEGLLILTNEGPLIQQLTDPRFHHPKTYFAQVEGLITRSASRALNTRIVLPGIQTKLPQVEIIPEPSLSSRSVPVRDYHPTSWLKLTIFEGKKHQVRRMTAAVGFPTLRLVRFSIGKITIDDLDPGEWRHLTKEETQTLKQLSNSR